MTLKQHQHNTMYKVTVTADGTTATASKHCHSMAEANAVKNKLGKWLKMPVKIEIVRIGGGGNR